MITLALAKQHVRVDTSEEDALIAQYLAAAVAWVENYTGKKLTRGVVTQEVRAFGAYMALHWGPSPASLTINYTDADDAPQTITDAVINGERAYPAGTWPTMAENAPVSLSYTAGYTDTPADLDSAVLLLVGDLYQARETNQRDAAIEMAVEALCRPYRSLHV